MARGRRRCVGIPGSMAYDAVGLCSPATHRGPSHGPRDATCTSVEAVAGAVGPTTPFILVDQASDSRIVAFLAETWRLRQGARGPLVERLLAQATVHATEPHLASRVLAGTSAEPKSKQAEPEPKADTPGETTLPRRDGDSVTPTARPLWNHPAILLALLAACGVEWWIRERLGDGP